MGLPCFFVSAHIFHAKSCLSAALLHRCSVFLLCCMDSLTVLALPLGELSPQVTERGSQPFYMGIVFPLRPRCARTPIPQGEASSKLCAQQTAILLSKKTQSFSDSLSPPAQPGAFLFRSLHRDGQLHRTLRHKRGNGIPAVRPALQQQLRRRVLYAALHRAP